jgi:hypothetical protein
MYQVQCTKYQVQRRDSTLRQNSGTNSNPNLVLCTWYLVLNSISNYSNKLIYLHLLYPLHPGVFPGSIAC